MKTLLLIPFFFLFISVLTQGSNIIKEVSKSDKHMAISNQLNGLSEKDIADIHSFLKSHEKNALASDWFADAQLYTEDAIRFPQNSDPIQGRKAIQSALETVESVSSFTHEILDINGCSNIAYIIVKYSFTGILVGSSEPFTATGKSLIILKKQSDNSWKFYRVMWN